MNKWINFAQKIVELISDLDKNRIEHLPYAMAYAQSILENLNESRFYGYTQSEATKIQMLYLICNLEGASEEEFNQIEEMCGEVGIDISDNIKEMIAETNEI